MPGSILLRGRFHECEKDCRNHDRCIRLSFPHFFSELVSVQDNGSSTTSFALYALGVVGNIRGVLFMQLFWHDLCRFNEGIAETFQGVCSSLEKANLVKSKREGKWVFYSLQDKRVISLMREFGGKET